jgi:hypothetical protein
MSDHTGPVTGGCMCGAVRYEVIGKPMEIGDCHCHSCRRHTGAPVVIFVMFEANNVRFVGRERSIYNSSPGVKRAFCSNCGTPLSWEGNHEGHEIIEFHISTFDKPDDFVPDRHWYHDERITWFDVADDLPRYRGAGMKDEEPYRHGPAIQHPEVEGRDGRD